MLRIKLKRIGKKNKPLYKIVVVENLSKLSGKSIADIGYYNPFSNHVNFKNTFLYKFINLGALPTNTVRHLIFKTLKNNIKV